jgi:hypothetical protein
MINRTVSLVCVLILGLSLTALADWIPQDGHKMHFPQMPDSTGWAVCATVPVQLADDFMCTETGWIKDIHFWGGWRHNEEGELLSFILRLHDDIPANQSGTGYSMPGETLIEWTIETWSEVVQNPLTQEGWYNPMTDFVFPDDHSLYTQYNVFLDQSDWFHQDSGSIYWLSISANVVDPINSQWGWKSSQDHWNDNATFGDIGDDVFEEMYEPDPVDTLTGGFFISVDQSGTPWNWGGTNQWGTWFGYGFSGDPWWLLWFYDHPVDDDRHMEVLLEFDMSRYPTSLPSWSAYVEISVNWSWDTWGSSSSPPPAPFGDTNIYRSIVFADSVPHDTVSYTIPFTIGDYNPEWVAVGIWGDNYEILDGQITHICSANEIEPLDLAFVITSSDPVQSGACCYPGGSDDLGCVETTQAECEEAWGGVFLGPGTDCLGDGDGNNIDDACEGSCGQYTGGISGNANCSEDGKLTLSDISRMIDRVYISKEALCCEATGNTNDSVEC